MAQWVFPGLVYRLLAAVLRTGAVSRAYGADLRAAIRSLWLR
jgi:hypothetical protein